MPILPIARCRSTDRKKGLDDVKVRSADCRFHFGAGRGAGRCAVRPRPGAARRRHRTCQRRRHRGHRHAQIRNPVARADQRQRVRHEKARHRGHQECAGSGEIHPGARDRPDQQQHLDPRDQLHRRIGHHRHLYRRHPGADPQHRCGGDQFAAQRVRPRPGRSAARAAGYAVRHRGRGRRDPLYHQPAQPDRLHRHRACRDRRHPGRHPQL